MGFEPTISAGKRPQTYALDRADTGTGGTYSYYLQLWDASDCTTPHCHNPRRRQYESISELAIFEPNLHLCKTLAISSPSYFLLTPPMTMEESTVSRNAGI